MSWVRAPVPAPDCDSAVRGLHHSHLVLTENYALGVLPRPTNMHELGDRRSGRIESARLSVIEF
jgi:hypothetical protein